jgi:hypothetical protein
MLNTNLSMLKHTVFSVLDLENCTRNKQNKCCQSGSLKSTEAGLLVWIRYVPVLKYVPFPRKGMTLGINVLKEVIPSLGTILYSTRLYTLLL